MILPTKDITIEQALITAGADIIMELTKPVSVSELWLNVRETPSIKTYERFILALDMLHILGVVIFRDGKLVKQNPQSH